MATLSKKEKDKVAKKALTFYAKQTAYKRRTDGTRKWKNPRVLADGGRRAREALAAL